ncbi:response regulator [Geotoga petraea]|jgi:DNA-binding response OmpR family regulator|uniref:Response regulator receiver domain-containing protein n=1 Tax=Geotoga petraea TaxID=28234 RepID=A0A1G6KZI0_9BACT|nr:response regulator [Geotoga petraea]SDC35756.1 Response regulator receiver domain-containing protein [Geotoga petraea]
MNNKSIFVIEDYDIDYEIIKKEMEENGIINEIKRFKNAEDAIKELEKKEKPSIILLDIMLPEMNGIDFLKAVKKEKLLEGIKVIVLTKKEEDKNRIDSFNLGAVGYMNKPFDINDFINIVRSNGE